MEATFRLTIVDCLTAERASPRINITSSVPEGRRVSRASIIALREFLESQCENSSPSGVLPHCNPGGIDNSRYQSTDKKEDSQDSRMPNWAFVCGVTNSIGNC